ncbi:MAG: glycosyltransferase family 2 protein [Betaproteobacteria bacterium]|nr:glycosyltransferase family 2 protein [Betaproteobacteria bacterium]
MTLSVSIIVKNGEPLVRRCLESVTWANEIIVVDSGSTDNTLAICRELGAQVTQTADFPGYGTQKNRALDHTTGDWILALDHDEWVTPELRNELEAIMANPGGIEAYALPRLSNFCGRDMRHSGWWPDPVIRFFRKGAGRFAEDHMHDRVVVTGKLGRLKNHLRHDPMPTLEHVLNKVNGYSSAGAKFNLARGKRASLTQAIFHGWWAFMRTYIFKAGFLDGREGFILSVSNAEGTYYRYLKLMMLGKTPPPR